MWIIKCAALILEPALIKETTVVVFESYYGLVKLLSSDKVVIQFSQRILSRSITCK